MNADDQGASMAGRPETYAAFMAHLFGLARHSLDQHAGLANGQPGILLYLNTDDGLRPHTLQVFESGGPGTGIGHVLVYQDSQLFELFEKDLATDR